MRLTKLDNWILRGQPCVLCHGAPGPLCGACLAALPVNDRACRRCALPLISARATLCANCLRRAPAVDASWSPWHYAHPLDWLLRQAKLHQRRDLLQILAALLRATAPTSISPMLMLPVPLHPRRLAERGYNQSEVLFAPLCARLGIAFDHRRLIRARDTPTQTALSRPQRRRNLRAAFTVNGPLPPVVGICDDVITTGATVEEIARLLKRNGVRQVIAWSLARAA